jgi:hypothetical protein
MNVVPFPIPPKAPVLDGTEAILTGFTRLLADMQIQQKRLNQCDFCPELRHAMMLDLATSSLRVFDANIKFLNQVKTSFDNEVEAG